MSGACGRCLEKEDVGCNGCQGVAEGDTREVLWVYTTWDTKAAGVIPMGAGLNACMTTTCANPQLRVVVQVFVLQKEGRIKIRRSAAQS